jgi:hypothetical protein
MKDAEPELGVVTIIDLRTVFANKLLGLKFGFNLGHGGV